MKRNWVINAVACGGRNMVFPVLPTDRKGKRGGTAGLGIEETFSFISFLRTP